MTLAFSKNSPPEPSLMLRAVRKRPKHARPPRAWKAFIVGQLLGLLICAGGIVAGFLALAKLGVEKETNGLLGPVLGVLIVYLLLKLNSRMSIVAIAFPYVSGTETTYLLDETGVTASCGGGSAQIEWKSLSGFVEGKGGLFFYHSNIFMVISDEALGARREEAVAAVRSWANL